MHVLGQNDPGVDVETGLCTNPADRVAESIDFAHKQVAPPVKQIDGEEICATGNAVAPVIRHDTSVAAAHGAGKAVLFGARP
jgi:hypothetical protein